MRDSALKTAGFAFYVSELEKGSTDPYFAYRVYETSWMVPQEQAAIVRRATVRLVEADPWFLATAIPYFLSSLETKDLERLTPFVGAGQAPEAAAMLRATLWYYGRKGPFHPDRAGLVQLRRALSYLKKVPLKQRDRAWHEMTVGCFRVLDYGKCKRAYPSLREATPPEWRASDLHGFLNVVRKKKDWKTYDRFRGEWEQLPPRHHACECYLNDLHTNDGLRAAAAGKWAAIPEALTKAADVRGCAHLNSGGLRLDLVELLVSKKKLLRAARAYLERAASFKGSLPKVTSLQRKVDAFLRG